MATFDHRRELSRRELLPALGAGAGAGIAVGAVVAYVTQLMLRREPLPPPSARRERGMVDRPGGA